jgi:3-phenylpropionate/trans-cinnamate dioxygenase ferredoxin subunit
MKAVEAGGAALLVCNVGGRLYAVRDECTHEGFPLSEGSVEGETVVCRLHGARFDLRSGEVLAPPAYEPLETYEVRVDGDDVWVAVESRGSEG